MKEKLLAARKLYSQGKLDKAYFACKEILPEAIRLSESINNNSSHIHQVILGCQIIIFNRKLHQYAISLNEAQTKFNEFKNTKEAKKIFGGEFIDTENMMLNAIKDPDNYYFKFIKKFIKAIETNNNASASVYDFEDIGQQEPILPHLFEIVGKTKAEIVKMLKPTVDQLNNKIKQSQYTNHLLMEHGMEANELLADLYFDCGDNINSEGANKKDKISKLQDAAIYYLVAVKCVVKLCKFATHTKFAEFSIALYFSILNTWEELAKIDKVHRRKYAECILDYIKEYDIKNIVFNCSADKIDALDIDLDATLETHIKFARDTLAERVNQNQILSESESASTTDSSSESESESSSESESESSSHSESSSESGSEVELERNNKRSKLADKETKVKINPVTITASTNSVSTNSSLSSIGDSSSTKSVSKNSSIASNQAEMEAEVKWSPTLYSNKSPVIEDIPLNSEHEHAIKRAFANFVLDKTQMSEVFRLIAKTHEKTGFSMTITTGYEKSILAALIQSLYEKSLCLNSDNDKSTVALKEFQQQASVNKYLTKYSANTHDPVNSKNRIDKYTKAMSKQNNTKSYFDTEVDKYLKRVRKIYADKCDDILTKVLHTLLHSVSIKQTNQTQCQSVMEYKGQPALQNQEIVPFMAPGLSGKRDREQ